MDEQFGTGRRGRDSLFPGSIQVTAISGAVRACGRACERACPGGEMPVHGLHELLTWSGAGWLPPVCGREMGGSLVFSCLKVCMSTYPEEESFGSGRRDVRVGKIGWASTESVCASWISALQLEADGRANRQT